LNAAVAVETALPAAALLRALHEIERTCGRERVVRWDARTLDLDLLTFGTELSDDPALLVPHPRMHERRFVMVPVCDIDPDMPHPRLGRSMAELLRELPAEPGDLKLFDAAWGEPAPALSA
jgi:2-amino-4-hydroxy-6-hydroxymethyldihydropteridine diphosphokinase